MLVREGSDDWTLGMFYIAVVQSVILYGSETWFMFLHIGRTLGRFHNRVVRRLVGRQPKRRMDGTLGYPPLAEAMA